MLKCSGFLNEISHKNMVGRGWGGLGDNHFNGGCLSTVLECRKGPGDEVAKQVTFLSILSPSCEMASSSSTSTAATQTTPAKCKQVPASFSGLLDLAIYSFGCQAGLRSHH